MKEIMEARSASVESTPETDIPFRFLIPALCLFAAVTAACKQETASMPPPGPPEVEVVTISTQMLADEPEFIGQAESSRPAEIRSQVTGILKEIHFQEGRDVKKGDRLYRIDPVPFEAAYASAKARVAQAEARLVQAKQNLARVKPLLVEQAVSQKDVDDAIAEDLAAKAALQGAKADLIKAKFDYDNTLIVAPISGMIERSKIYEGRLVSAQTDLLNVIHRLDPIYVIVSLPENYLLQRRRELSEKKVESPDVYQLKGVITFADRSTYSREGTLDLLDVGLRTETGARQGRFVFPNPDRVLLPGQFVRVRVKGYTKPAAILVPQRAVQQGPKGSMVFVVGQDDKVEMRPVQASGWEGNQWLIDEGLQAGERIIVEGMHKIAPGAPVKPVQANRQPEGEMSARKTEPEKARVGQ
ncbi:MAG TPA: efflux RND transporter periplasmic adaptor subunit [Nitrospiraceae bacterium]|nr:efflux RND transporter periplasmic adaptor subunit [Nitrospiraceae bacterium]